MTIREQLVNQPEQIIKILTALGIERNSIKQNSNRNEIYSPRPGGDNERGLIVYTDTLSVIGTTRSEFSGDIFTLVMTINGVGFKDALLFVAETLGIDVNQKSDRVTPFGGFFKKIAKSSEYGEEELEVYPEDSLPEQEFLSKKFLRDNISLNVQEKWGVRYSVDDDAILIPVYFGGNLVGCKARANSDKDMSRRWWAYLPYKKTNVLYGYDQNYAKIIQKGVCIITESEKGVMQLDSMGIHVGLAVGGHAISKTQASYIKAFGNIEVVIAFDEDVSEAEVKEECGKIILHSSFTDNKVSYIYDESGLYLPKGMKDSPTDKGLDIFKELYKNRKVVYGQQKN